MLSNPVVSLAASNKPHLLVRSRACRLAFSGDRQIARGSLDTQLRGQVVRSCVEGICIPAPHENAEQPTSQSWPKKLGTSSSTPCCASRIARTPDRTTSGLSVIRMRVIAWLSRDRRGQTAEAGMAGHDVSGRLWPSRHKTLKLQWADPQRATPASTIAPAVPSCNQRKFRV